MSAEELLRKHEDNFVWIKQRYFFLKEFIEVMDSRTKGGRYEMANNTVFQMVRDCYDMLAIDLASLCRGMVGKGGFFNNLNNHLSEMKLAKANDVAAPRGGVFYVDHQPSEAEQKEIEEGIRQDFIETYLKNNESAFYKLFPLAKDRVNKKIQQEDIKHLKDRFYEMAEAIIEDRDGNRAHRFENQKHNRAAQRAEKLSVEKIGLVFDQVEDFLNDIRLITNHSSFAYNDLNNCNVEATGKDLIDLVLLGTSIQTHLLFGVNDRLNRHGHPYWPKLREDFYERLHENHLKIGDKIRAKAVEEYQKDGDYKKIRIPDLPVNKFKPRLLDSKKELIQFVASLESRLQTEGLLKSLDQLQRDGSSSAGTHSIEELFTREFLCPTISSYFREEIRDKLNLSDEQITNGLGTEGFQNCPGFGFTPARRQAHFFTKSDVIRPDPPTTWFKSSEKALTKFQACPDFAISDPLPFRAVGEVKFFKEGSKETAVKELFNATRQATFYLGAFCNEYDAAILVVADASPGHVFKAALEDLHPDFLSRYGEATGVHLAVIGLI